MTVYLKEDNYLDCVKLFNKCHNENRTSQTTITKELCINYNGLP